jgi:phosphoribosyl-ATP pyrophosphohydrolase/phosphoribosyl-AMP cyclohydrolase
MENVDFAKSGGLVPVVVQEYETNEILMLAYMNEEALQLTQQTGFAHYFSRSKQRIWKKGESSGHVQEIKEIMLDCDDDTLLLKVKQNGVACHTGKKSCFFKSLTSGDMPINETSSQTFYDILDTLVDVIKLRKNENPENSYVASLFEKGDNAILKKVVEEAGELCFAIKDKDEKEIIYEAADLVFHLLVALGNENIHLDRVRQELSRRFGLSGIEEKNSR